jgi:hypothetical protein
MSNSFVNTGGEADREDAAASDLQARNVHRDTATRSMIEEIGNYSFPSSLVRSSSNLDASTLQWWTEPGL